MCAVCSTYLYLTFTTARLVFTVSTSGEQAPGFFYCQRECMLPSGLLSFYNGLFFFLSLFTHILVFKLNP